MAVVCILSTAACTSNQSGKLFESVQPARGSGNSQQTIVIDVENKYKIARQQGDLEQICKRAQLTASTYFYIQGYDSTTHQFWKSIESRDCKAFQAEESRMLKEEATQMISPFRSVMNQTID